MNQFAETYGALTALSTGMLGTGFFTSMALTTGSPVAVAMSGVGLVASYVGVSEYNQRTEY